LSWLAIAHDIVQAHGGTIEAASQEGTGTTVRFTLPIRA
jgi:signal transduction histidine kinase